MTAEQLQVGDTAIINRRESDKYGDINVGVPVKIINVVGWTFDDRPAIVRVISADPYLPLFGSRDGVFTEGPCQIHVDRLTKTNITGDQK